MNNTRNPIRRNRNIGTAKSGYSQNNKLVIPSKWIDFRVFWERLNSPVIYPIKIQGHELTMLIEAPKEGYVHASTPSDIIEILNLIPRYHLEEIEIIVLRQPKKKEEILKSVWGRFVYYADLGRYSGAGIYIESVKVDSVLKWGNSITPFDKKELLALESDGHKIKQVKRGYEIHTTPHTVRNTQLFRTLPHEIGHAIDYLKNSIDPAVEAESEEESDYISRVFDAKPSLDKEEYANRYAKEFYSKWSVEKKLPFNKIYDEEHLKSIGLNPKWFDY